MARGEHTSSISAPNPPDSIRCQLAAKFFQTSILHRGMATTPSN